MKNQKLALIIAISIVFLISSKYSFSYPDIIENHLLADSKLSYLLNLHYSKGGLELVQTELVEGKGPDRKLQPERGYTAKINSLEGSLKHYLKFNIPLSVISEDETISGIIELDEITFSIAMPYFSDGKSVDIFDPQGTLKLTIDVSQFSRPDLVKAGNGGQTTGGGGDGGTCFTFDQKDGIGNIIYDAEKENRAIIKDGLDVTPTDDAAEKTAQGKLGEAMQFDGMDDVVAIPYMPETDPAKTGELTISAWVYPETRAESPVTIVAKPPEEGFIAVYPLGLDSHGHAAFAVTSGEREITYAVSEQVIPINQWTEITGVIENNQLNLYLDGVKQEGSVELKTPIEESSRSTLIGGSSVPTASNFDGRIDEVAVLNYAAGPAQVAALADQGCGGGLPTPEPSPTECSPANPTLCATRLECERVAARWCESAERCGGLDEECPEATPAPRTISECGNNVCEEGEEGGPAVLGTCPQDCKVALTTILVQGKEISLKCVKDEECTIINKDIDFKKCNAGTCETVDYSMDNYIAVNKGSFEEYQSAESSLRPSADSCGPAPACPVSIANSNYQATCANQLCRKSALG